MTHPTTGEMGIWLLEQDFGDLLAGIVIEKGAVELRVAENLVRAELAETENAALRKGLKSSTFWSSWGLPLGFIMGFVTAAAVAFVGVWLGDELKQLTPAASYSVDFTAGDYRLRVAW